MTLTMDEEPEYPTYPTATAAEIIDELYQWLEMYTYSELLADPQEAKYLQNTVNSLAGVELVQTIPDWVYWLDMLAVSYGSKGLANAARAISNGNNYDHTTA